MNTMKYKGYQALITYWDDDNTFVGRVLCANDVIGFEGQSVTELEEMFHSALDHYLEGKEDKEPAKPLTGKFEVKIPPEQLARELFKTRNHIEEKEVDSLLRACGHEPGEIYDDSRERFWICWKNFQKVTFKKKEPLKKAV
ncbi:MAG: type II toxin-antitoxin system HicB family antitoxin [Candidatus Omnitrophota bacterium]|jgi:predicted HicB family RNase H-like nuclease|nr:MAG: type II toxin-antitoxin system HicB family antitoxin [Candidatus Omnitrophota bacterium]